MVGLYPRALELPGCHAQGKTLDELMERTREAIEAYCLKLLEKLNWKSEFIEIQRSKYKISPWYELLKERITPWRKSQECTRWRWYVSWKRSFDHVRTKGATTCWKAPGGRLWSYRCGSEILEQGSHRKDTARRRYLYGGSLSHTFNNLPKFFLHEPRTFLHHQVPNPLY